MSGNSRKSTGIDLLDRFERFGVRFLKILLEQDPEIAEAYRSRLLKALEGHDKQLKRTASPVTNAREEQSVDRSSEVSQTSSGRRSLTKLRQGYLVEALILKSIARESRATTINSLFDALLSAQLIEPDSRSALVARLNRMKNEGRLIDWEKENRAQAISITNRGAERLAELMGQLLQRSEIEYLETNAAWMFDESTASNVVHLRSDRN